MKFRGSDTVAEKIEPQMAPMIDVVFQLLIFFMLTLKIIEPEGSFSINMPQGKPKADPTQQITIPPLKITMDANADGSLRALQIGRNPAQRPIPETNPDAIRTYIKLKEDELLSSEQAARRIGEDRLFQQLNEFVAKYVRDQLLQAEDKEKARDEMKAKISFAYNLQQRYVINATSACRGRMRYSDKEERREELIKNIEFVRPARPKTGG
ncbi:MAG: ExbD/TolR family protein [Planctomycetaceae bacterium]